MRIETFGGECSLEEIDRLMKIGKEAECNSVIAVGGGKAIDTGKAVAVRLDVPSLLFPPSHPTMHRAAAFPLYTTIRVWSAKLSMEREIPMWLS